MLPALALLMASCANDEPAVNDEHKAEYAGANSYLNITLRPSQGSAPMFAKGTRADGDYQESGGTYVDGDAVENNVTSVRFYFFNESGDPFAVRLNTTTNEYDNFIDWYPNDDEVGGPNHEETVEKTLNATLGLTFSDNEERPSQVVAIANPTDEILFYTTNAKPEEDMSANCMSLKTLQGITYDYLPYQENNFVMSNSVYADEKKLVCTTTLIDDNFQATPDAAAKNPVTIYIERVLARLDLGITMAPATLQNVAGTFYQVGTYTINNYDEENGETNQEDQAIYIKLLGWNVTSTTGSSYLLKSINPTWEDANILGTNQPWSVPTYHRSFWAINPNNVEINYGNFGTFDNSTFTGVENEGQFATSLKIPASQTDFVKTYLQENASPFNSSAAPAQPTKVILAAQLVNAQGEPITMCEWGYNKYTLDGLKNQLAKVLSNLYYKTEKDGQDAWAQITPGMLTFTTVDPLPDANDKSYYVYAVLTDDAAKETWALRNGATYTPFSTDGGKEEINVQVNKYIRGIVNHAMVWNTGLTYYFFDVRHLGTSNQNAGYLGIVRNHIYRSTVSSIEGLGTPVYDPKLEIIPEVTNPGETVIAAKINILSWRLVENSYELKW